MSCQRESKRCAFPECPRPGGVFYRDEASANQQRSYVWKKTKYCSWGCVIRAGSAALRKKKETRWAELPTFRYCPWCFDRFAPKQYGKNQQLKTWKKQTHCSIKCKNQDPTTNGTKPLNRLKPNAGGYLITRRNGKAISVHRLEYEKHNGPIPPGCTIHHKNGIRTDWNIDNLELKMGSHGRGQTVDDILNYVVKYFPDRMRKLLDAQQTEAANA